MMSKGKAERYGTLLTRSILIAMVLVSSLIPLTSARAQSQAGDSLKRLGLRLRSFIPEARGTIYFEPTMTGGRVRLTAMGLPAPQELLPQGSAYVVWAVAPGLSPLRVGLVQADAEGNGGLEFDRPPAFERYSVIVTAETSPDATSPLGVMVLATRAGAVSAFYGAMKKETAKAELRRLRLELGRRSSVRRAAPDFFAEVDEALAASGGGRLLELFGDEVTPDAHGIARVTSRNQKGYLRALLSNMPLPSTVGARNYVMWSVQPSGRIVYMGSLPTTDLNNQDIYTRVGGIGSDDFDLFVTAELKRPVSRPSLRRALSTRAESDSTLAYGAIEGRVLDSAGNAVAGVKVEAVPVGRRAYGLLPTARTDERGRFFLDGVTPGANALMTSKEEEGYASTYFPFFMTDSQSVPQVTVVNQQVTSDVLVHLGPKAARVSGKILDAETGRPIRSAEIIYYRTDNSDLYYSTGPNGSDGSFENLLPPVGLKVKVSAPGYEDWFFGQDGSKERSQILQLRPGAAHELNISLRPRKTSRNSPRRMPTVND
ncbi:MAG: carboxypeptidase-like regulatory domain-containing protein [Acidobacteriota bacterium]|nr:carboxypeptidase-like regulatory domain-containing protein [Acidobacteriota bacterium]